MGTPKQNLTRKRNKLNASAGQAATLAQAERAIADQQHVVAHNLEVLADDLKDQVIAADAELEAIATLDTSALTLSGAEGSTTKGNKVPT